MSATPERSNPEPGKLRERLSTAVLAFRGYNVTNLGRSAELLERSRYRDTMERWLDRGSHLCQDVLGYPVDLATRVREQRDTSLASYGEAISLVVAVSLAQLDLLREEFGIDWQGARYAYGYSLGELTAVIAGGAISFEDALRIPLELSDDCVALAAGTTLAVVFSLRAEISMEVASEICEAVNLERRGVVGISARLAPNSILLIGQGDSIDRFTRRLTEVTKERIHVRKNEHRWPPLHTPIVWERAVACRSKERMHAMPTENKPPRPPVFSLVTGALGYHQHDLRQLFGDWIDKPQCLWEAVEFTLAKGITDLLHVGPQPNIIPATFDRVGQNVAAQLKSSGRMRALSQVARRAWLQAILPRRAALLRAPQVRHVILEDWLLTHD